MADFVETYALLAVPFLVIAIGCLAAEFLPKILKR